MFAAGPGDAGNLWEIALSAGRVQGPPSASHKLPATSCTPRPRPDNARSRLAYSSLEWKPRSGPDARRRSRIATGEPASITIDEPSSLGPSLSADGRYLAYLEQPAWRQVGARARFDFGQAITLVSSPSGFFNPRISGDGATVAYSDRSGNIFSSDARTGGAAETLCAGVYSTTAGKLSADGKRISYEPAESKT